MRAVVNGPGYVDDVPAMTFLKAKMEEIKAKYGDGELDELDGISVEYDNWRFNVRISNTEPLLRLNVESKGDVELLNSKTEELLQIIRN